MTTTSANKPLRIIVSGTLEVPADQVAALTDLGDLPLGGLVGTVVGMHGQALAALAVSLGANDYDIDVTSIMSGGGSSATTADPEA